MTTSNARKPSRLMALGMLAACASGCGTDQAQATAGAAKAPVAQAGISPSAAAEPAEPAQWIEARQVRTWRGHGVVFDIKGKPIAEYGIELKRTGQGGGKMLHQVKIDLPGGRTKEIACQLKQTERGWTSDCGTETGAGSCLGDGMCVDYCESPDGKAFATNLFVVGDTMRLLRTELREGKAVRLYREKLLRIAGE